MTYCNLKQGMVLAVLGIFLMGCSSPPSLAEGSSGDRPPTIAQPTAPATRGQQLPISAVVTIAGQQIQLEVARTPEQQAIGLMYRTQLPDDRGMLFAFESPYPARFWMRNTLIPLDMIFMLNGEVKSITANAQPCTTQNCPLYGPGVNVDQVLELRGGRAAELGINVGDRLNIQYLN